MSEPVRHFRFAPRFTGTVWAPRYGSRDEIAGYRCVFVCHAETREWVRHLINQYVGPDMGPDYDGWYELDVRVIDNEPWRARAYGPEVPWWMEENGDLLPF